MTSGCRRTAWVFLGVCSLLAAWPREVLAQAPPPPAVVDRKADAKQHLDAASAAEKKKDYAHALEEYRAAYAAEPSPTALNGQAIALQTSKQLPEAYAVNEKLVVEPGTSAAMITAARARLVALEAQTGTLVVSGAPDGAVLAIDGAVPSTTVATPIRVLPGAHRIVVTKPGFVTRELGVDVAAGAAATVEAALVAEMVPVSIAGPMGAMLSVDGKPVGPLPWTGELAVGPHEVSATSETATVPTQTITVESGKKLELSLEAKPRVGTVALTTTDPKAVVFLDGKAVGEGQYRGEVPVGDHQFSIVLEGFEREEISHRVAEGEAWSQVVTLRVKTNVPPAEKKKDPDDASGLVTEFRLAGNFQLGSAGSESEDNCATIGSHCTADTPKGFGLLFAIGYMTKHLGGDVFFGPTFDGASRSYTKLQNGDATYAVQRVGGVQAIRARGSLQNRWVRGNLALGPGISERVVGTNDTVISLPKSIQTYISLAFTADINAELRITRGFGITLGTVLWIENAGHGVTTGDAPTNGSFHLVAGTQTFLMPYLGLQFGP